MHNRNTYLVAAGKSYQKCLLAQSLARNAPHMQPHCHTGCPGSNEWKSNPAGDENNLEQLLAGYLWMSSVVSSVPQHGIRNHLSDQR